MGLTFAPLGWIYHDGWNFDESKLLRKAGASGESYRDASRHYYHRGHVHLFLPGHDEMAGGGKVGSTKAYWGEQTYHFHIKDEWGPNSDDPSQDQSLILIGRPIWHVRVEEYWRRMYIQPYDREDPSNHYPLNQRVEYRAYDRAQYIARHVEEHGLTESLKDYLKGREDEAAMALFWEAVQERDAEDAMPEVDGEGGGGEEQSRPSSAEEYREWISGDASGALAAAYEEFKKAYKNRGGEFIDEAFETEEFLRRRSERYGGIDLAKYKRDRDGRILVPTGEPVGHSGIRYDAALARHSLGPFREGIEFFFWYSVVNRGMPVEYWVDEDRRTREYLLKRKAGESSDDTRGGQTWTFADDSSKWWYVEESWEECSAREDYMWNDFDRACPPDAHRMLPGIRGLDENGYFRRPENSKPLKNDRAEYRGGRWFGTNEKVVMDPDYDYSRKGAKSSSVSDGTGVDPDAIVNPATGLLPSEEQAFRDELTSSSSSPDPGQSPAEEYAAIAHPEIDWEKDTANGTWDGWYEYGELVRCPQDGGHWYVRAWRPNGYSAGNLGDDGLRQPCWTRQKRRCFPNPQPWLCDAESGLHPAAVPSAVFLPRGVDGDPLNPESPFYHFATDPDPWKTYDRGKGNPTKEDCLAARRHLLRWEYARYYRLVTDHESNGNYRHSFRFWFRLRYHDPVYDANHAVVSYDDGWIEDCVDASHVGQILCQGLSWEPGEEHEDLRGDEQIPDIPEEWLFAPSDSPHLSGDNLFIYPPSGHVYVSVEPAYERPPVALNWESALDAYAYSNGGEYPSPEDEEALFAEWLSALMEATDEDGIRDHDLRVFEDRTAFYETRASASGEVEEVRIDPSRIGSDGRYDAYDAATGETVRRSPDHSALAVGYATRLSEGNYLTCWPDEAKDDIQDEYPTYVSFEEFAGIWRLVDGEEASRRGLSGDMPVRKSDVPWFGEQNDEEDTLLAKLEEIWPTDELAVYRQSFPEASEVPLDAEGEPPLWVSSTVEWRKGLHKKYLAARYAEACPSRMFSSFSPRVDDGTRAENRRRAASKSVPPPPQLALSPLDDYGEGSEPPNYGFDPIDCFPREDGADEPISPVDVWRKYYDHREIWTIPNGTKVPGDRTVVNDEGQPNWPDVHPRETAYSAEDGARRLVPDGEYVTPVIEYQRVLRTNATDRGDGYCRMPGKEADQAWIDANWKTCDRSASFGDGFDLQVTIPWTVGGEIQSPFSGADRVTRPAGEYFHSCVRETDKMRYHVEWYDSFDQIRKWDYPSWVDLMHGFQRKYVASEDYRSASSEEGFDDRHAYRLCRYRIDYDNPAKEAWVVADNDDDREYTPASVEPLDGEAPDDGYRPIKWSEAMAAYWTAMDAKHGFSGRPVTRDRDAYGNKMKPNSFVQLANGEYVWRGDATEMLVSTEDVPKEFDPSTGKEVYGYRDDDGNLVKGGGVVRFNNPFPDREDGRWVEQCLGAIVKAKCTMVFEDRLGHRFQQVVTATALTPDDPLVGSDYDAG